MFNTDLMNFLKSRPMRKLEDIKTFVDVNKCDMTETRLGGVSVLSIAILNGYNVDVIQYFIKSGCDVDQQDANGKTPVMISFYEFREEVSWLLIQASKHLNVRCERGWTLVDYALQSSCSSPLLMKIISLESELSESGMENGRYLKLQEEYYIQRLITLKKEIKKSNIIPDTMKVVCCKFL